VNATANGTMTNVDRLNWLSKVINLWEKYNNFDVVVLTWNPNSNFTLADKDGKVWPMELINWGPMNASVLN
jgi:hypothetical protein